MKRIYLIGYMGVGKTTIGKQLSNLLQLSFIDLDKFIECKYHKTISQLFQEKGESGFRELEKKSLVEISEIEDVVIATGGGTPCFFDNIGLMNATGTTIYIKAEPDELVEQLKLSKRERPLIAHKTPEMLLPFVTAHLLEREIFYNRAKMIHRVRKLISNKELQDTVKEIATELKKMQDDV